MATPENASCANRRAEYEGTVDPNADRARRRCSNSFLVGRPHSYVPFTPRRQSMVMLDRVAGVSKVNDDCRHVYPFISGGDASGGGSVIVMVSEYDFHARIQRKYGALLGDRYVYPVLLYDDTRRASVPSDAQLVDVTREDKDVLECFIPHEVEVMITGGILTFKKDYNDNLYIVSRAVAGSHRVFLAKTREILCREMKEFRDRQEANAIGRQFCAPANHGDITADDIITQLIAGMKLPDVRRVKNVLGYSESGDEILAKLRAVGLLHKYEVELDDENYFRNFIVNKSRIFDDTCDIRAFRRISYLPALNKKSESETSERDNNARLESEVEVEPLRNSTGDGSATPLSCDSGLGSESPPLSPRVVGPAFSNLRNQVVEEE